MFFSNSGPKGVAGDTGRPGPLGPQGLSGEFICYIVMIQINGELVPRKKRILFIRLKTLICNNSG